MDIPFLLIILLLIGGGILSVITRKLNTAGATAGILSGLFIYAGGGLPGLLLLAAFFILGTAATSWKLKVKEPSGLAEENKGRRTAGQVIANAGVAATLGAIAWLHTEHHIILRLMMAASFASATADTLSSELGNYYGKKFYNIITAKPDIKGLNGVISLEGSLLGIAGSACIALIYSLGYGWSLHVLWIIIAGTTGNIFDSVLGATLERKRKLNNNAVNFLNTLVGAIAGGLLYLLS